MITLRCTAPLLKQLGGPDPDVPSNGRLGDWEAKIVANRPRRLVLCTNERSLLCVVIPFAPYQELRERFVAAAQRLIQLIPAPATARLTELGTLSEVRLGRATNRSVLSSMTHFGHAVDAWFEGDHPDDLHALSLWLCDTPCFPLSTNWPWLEAELLLVGSVLPGRSPFKSAEHVI